MDDAMMSDSDVLHTLKELGAIHNGHFVLTSGRHSDTYVQCARILENPEVTTRLAKVAAARLSGLEVDLVASPAVGGIIFGFAVAQTLGVDFIFSEREAGKMTFRRGFSVPEGSRVLIVEDVITTGGSVKEVSDLVREANGVPVGVVSLIDRGGEKLFGEPSYPILQLDIDSWEPDSCVLCAKGEPVVSPGSRRISSK
ncbi:MAG: orotate phosphoribosyltransferase [Actinobacteria bacterium]|nr:orotate phosphoribosyltransferase [Actinomycetota bacterium]